jgi:mannan endo-1,4-beta-mannosidase
LWNPLPDGGSRLHWWGNSSGEDYARLWRLMFERMVNFHGLNNLIWLWSGGSHAFHPGDSRVDITSESVFVNLAVGSQAVRFAQTADYSDSSRRKLAMVGRSGGVPSPDALWRDNSMWLMWSLERGDFVIGSDSAVLPGVSTALNRFYNHELTIVLDELPHIVA